MSDTKKVYAAINAVSAALAREGIAKNRTTDPKDPYAPKFKFRGIDDVYNSLCSLLAEHKLVIVPRVQERICERRETAKGTPLFFVFVTVEYDLVSAEDGSMHTARVYGEAMDLSDKATNKALSAAYKYMAFQLFCIPLEGQDNDADATSLPPVVTVEDIRSAATAKLGNLDPTKKKQLRDRMITLFEEHNATLDNQNKLVDVPVGARAACLKAIQAL